MKYIKLFENIDFDNFDIEEEYDDPTYNEIFIYHKIFYKFLKDHNILDDYVQSYNPHSMGLGYRSLKKFLNTTNEKFLIISAFEWDYSSKWVEYHFKWKNIVSTPSYNYGIKQYEQI